MSTKSHPNESSSSDDSTLTPAQVRVLLLEEQQRINADLREAKQALAAACANIKNHTLEQVAKLRGRVAALKFKSQRIQFEIGTCRSLAKIPPPGPKAKQPLAVVVDTYYEAAQARLAELGRTMSSSEQ
jgi:hypothetical protein